jgi:uncharacterized SAM-binding protein YcdF (DUF218 family)
MAVTPGSPDPPGRAAPPEGDPPPEESSARPGSGPLALLALASILTIATCRLAAPGVARWLAAGEPPVASDLLIVVSGGAEERLVSAAGLFHEGYAPWILVTDPDPTPDEAVEILGEMGVPAVRVISCPGTVSSTLEDAICIRDILAGGRFASALVVTSPYHCRRLRLILSRVTRGMPIRTTIVSSRSLYWDPSSWWSHQEGWEVPAEITKLAWAWLTVLPARGSRIEAGRQGQTP